MTKESTWKKLRADAEKGNETNETEPENRYSELIKIERIGPELYRIEELDREKGYRTSTINSRTGKTIFEKFERK